MHAIMTEQSTTAEDQTMLVEIVDQDRPTGTDMVIDRYEVTVLVSTPTSVLYDKTRTALRDEGYSVGTWRDCGGYWSAPINGREKPSAAAASQSEADEMLAISQTLALRALKAADSMRSRILFEHKDPKRSYDYKQLAAALDAHCEQLAHLLWTRKHHAVGHGAVGDYPSAADTEKYLRELAEKEA